VASILGIMTRNAVRAPETVRLPGSVPVPAGFRGPVRIEAGRCVACGLCAYVCVSDAITGDELPAAYAWGYDPGRCTFCARCVDHCPGRALSMSPEPARAYGRPGELALQERIAFPPCTACGAPTRLATDEVVRRAFGEPSDATHALLRLCERCRRRRLQRGLAEAAGAGTGEEDA
jgi:formate hydrogenlyase subunit 6/NADH:ubiquinone oxidoreductase subunit I